MAAIIYTAYGPKREVIPNEPGNEMEPHYIEKIDENGRTYLEKDGETNTYAEIQSYKDECDVHSILCRYFAGDASVLSRQGVYIDATQLPTTYHEMYNLMAEQRDKFDQLPLEIKRKFDNSFNVWASTAGSEEWYKLMGIVQNAENNKPEGNGSGTNEGENAQKEGKA